MATSEQPGMCPSTWNIRKIRSLITAHPFPTASDTIYGLNKSGT